MNIETESKQNARRRASYAAVAVVVMASPLLAYAEKKEFKYTVGAGATVSITSQRGSITVKPAPGQIGRASCRERV